MQDSKTVRLYTIALIAVVIYGLTPLFTKIGTGSTDGITVGALRAIVASPLALAAIIVFRMPLPWRGNDKWLLIISGAGSLAVFPLLFSWGVQLTTAGHAAAGTATGAVMAGVLSALLNRRWPTLYWWIGITVGLAGAFLLIWEAIGLGVEGVTWQGDALVFAGMSSGVIGYIAGARLTHTAGAMAVTMWSVCVAAILERVRHRQNQKGDSQGSQKVIQAMSWVKGGQPWMTRPYSEDLRERVVRVVESGTSRNAAAKQFDVSISFVVKLMQRWKQRGTIKADKYGGWKKSKLAPHGDRIRALVMENCDITIDELCVLLAAEGIEAKRSTLGDFLLAQGLSRKKRQPTPPSRSALTSRRREPLGATSNLG